VKELIKKPVLIKVGFFTVMLPRNLSYIIIFGQKFINNNLVYTFLYKL